MMSKGRSSPYLILAFSLLVTTLSGCAEVQKIISVFWNGRINVNTSAFDIAEMSSGNDVTCSIMGDKTIRCLGTNINGSLGRFYGAPNNALKDVKQIALGKGFSCAITGDHNELKCFGANGKGQLGNGKLSASVEPLSVLDTENNNAPLVDVKQITAGENHACALLKNGRAVCWGDNSFGQLGNQNQEGFIVKTVMENERSPKPFQGIQSIVAGSNSTCVVAKEDLSLFCFGERFGVTKKINWNPEKIEIAGGINTIADVKQVGLGKNFGCALSRWQVLCWGSNNLKQLGTSINEPGVTKAVNVEVRYPIKAPLSKIEAIAVGDQHACAIHREEGTVFCWGSNQFGQLGTTSTHGMPEQVAVSGNNLTLKGAKVLAAGRQRTCIISRNDELFCWGNGAHGILGNNNLRTSYPTRVIDSNNDMLASSTAISIGDDHACVIGINKKIFCFGLNQFGQLGSRMIAGSALGEVYNIDTFGEKTCVVHGEKRNVGCFGGNDLTANTESKANSFTLEDLKNNLKPYQDAIGVSVGENHVCMITDQGVECIDYNTKPANQYVVQTDKKTPLKDIWLLDSKGKLDCGITREKGEIWCWGDWKKNQWATARQLTFAGKPTSDFLQLNLSNDQICGIHGVTGSVYCTADSEANQNSSNLQMVADEHGKPFSGVFSISGGKHHMCAINDKNHLYCWGSNEFGQLGIPKIESASTPHRVTIAGESHRKITRVTAGDSHTCFTTETDLSLFCFGKSFFNEGNSTTPIEYPL